jgi:hypothetical protein
MNEMCISFHELKSCISHRFELPFNIWCTGCDNHIGQGVRYNAEKKKIGNYYSTPILQFRMKCHLCDNWIEIHTDPKACSSEATTATQVLTYHNNRIPPMSLSMVHVKK